MVFRVLDADGIRVTSPVRIRVQNSGTIGGPTVAITNLSTGDVITGSYRMRFSAMPSGSDTLDNVFTHVSIDGGTWTRADSVPSKSGGTCIDTIHSLNLVDGVHTVRVRAREGGSSLWEYSQPVAVVLSSLPLVSISSPSSGATVSGDVNIVFTSSSPAGLSLMNVVYLDGKLLDTADASPFILATGALLDGSHTIQVKSIIPPSYSDSSPDTILLAVVLASV